MESRSARSRAVVIEGEFYLREPKLSVVEKTTGRPDYPFV
jgi:hypothetical protein